MVTIFLAITIISAMRTVHLWARLVVAYVFWWRRTRGCVSLVWMPVRVLWQVLLSLFILVQLGLLVLLLTLLLLLLALPPPWSWYRWQTIVSPIPVSISKSIEALKSQLLFVDNRKSADAPR